MRRGFFSKLASHELNSLIGTQVHGVRSEEEVGGSLKKVRVRASNPKDRDVFLIGDATIATFPARGKAGNGHQPRRYMRRVEALTMRIAIARGSRRSITRAATRCAHPGTTDGPRPSSASVRSATESADITGGHSNPAGPAGLPAR